MSMDPYVWAGLGILVIFAIGIGTVFKIYRNRTQEPDVEQIKEDVIDAVLPDEIQDIVKGQI